MEQYSVSKKNSILPLTAIWINLQDIILHERGKRRKLNGTWSHVHTSRAGFEVKDSWTVFRGWMGVTGEMPGKGHEIRSANSKGLFYNLVMAVVRVLIAHLKACVLKAWHSW